MHIFVVGGNFIDVLTCVTIVSGHLSPFIFLHLSILYWEAPSVSLLPAHKIDDKLLLTMFSRGSHRTLAPISPACISALVIWPPCLRPDPFRLLALSGHCPALYVYGLIQVQFLHTFLVKNIRINKMFTFMYFWQTEMALWGVKEELTVKV